MRRLVAGLCAFAAIAVLTGCEPLLIYNKQLPEFKAPADKALCVVLRPMAFTGTETVKIYCDQKCVGATEGNTVLSFDVAPGEHYVIGDGTNKSKVKFNFQAGKVYFIFHTVVTIRQTVGPATITIVTSSFKPMAGGDAMSKIESEKGKISWVQLNPNNPQEDLEEDDFEDLRKDYDKWAKDPKNAEDHRVEAEYPGY